MNTIHPNPESDRESAATSRTWQVLTTAHYLPLILGVAAGFAAFTLLLPLVPDIMMDQGYSAGSAGLVNALFMVGTVVGQIMSPRLLRAWGFLPVFILSALLLGLPALGYVWTLQLGAVITYSVLRGLGFGLLVVAQTGIVPFMFPHNQWGTAYAIMGVAIGVIQVVAFPLEGLIVTHFSYDLAIWITVAVSIGALLCFTRVPRHHRPRPSERSSSRPLFLRAPVLSAIALPLLILASQAAVYGLLTSFMTPAVEKSVASAAASLGSVELAVLTLGSMVVRYWSGTIADRTGEAGHTVIAGQIMAILGSGCIAAALIPALPLTVIVLLLTVGSFLFGGAFGVSQNETLLLFYERLAEEDNTEVTAFWNIAYDGGTAIGNYVFGYLIVALSYRPTFAIAVVAMVIVTLWAVGERRRYGKAVHPS